MKQTVFLIKLILFSCLLILTSITGYGQTTVSGTETSVADSQSIPGVNVI